jgi:predicted anti-sigma-YlaC factor YlaD
VKCKAVQKMMSRYLDDELSSGARDSVDAHLAQCAACEAEYAAQRQLWGLLARAEPIQPPDVINAVAARLAEPRGSPAFLAGLQLRTLSYAIAAAVLVGLFVWTGVWAGTAHHGADVGEHDRAFAELLSDAPPGMEVVVVLDQIGERP